MSDTPDNVIDLFGYLASVKLCRCRKPAVWRTWTRNAIVDLCEECFEKNGREKCSICPPRRIEENPAQPPHTSAAF